MPVQTLRPQLSALTEKSTELSSHSAVPPLRQEGLATPVDSAGSHVAELMEPAVTEPTMSADMRQMFAKLIDDKGNLDMRNVTSLIWANRRDPALIKAVTEQLIENSNEQTVFNGIEFYLPQLAHMVVHLEVEVPTSALEQFALVICQQSLHVALQLNWILLAALEDYQPETADGEANPHANTLYFARCAKLLQNVERIIALGSPAAAKLEELYYRGKLSKTEIERLAMQDRKKNARQIIDGSISPRGSANGGSERGVSTRAAMEGPLWHKRWHSRERPHRHQWIRRWFAVEDRVLYCYRMTGGGGRGGGVKRAIVLNHADVEERDYKNHKYPYYFEVTSPMGNMRLRADSRDDMERWITVLREEAQAPPVMHLHVAYVDSTAGPTTVTGASTGAAGAGGRQAGTNGEAAARSRGSTADGGAGGPEGYSPALDLLSPGTDRAQLAEQQRRRYEFFDGQRTFVRSLTDICEELRFIGDRSLRTTELEKRLRKLQIPDICYLPLCKSTDPFRKVLRIPPGEARAFSTKARCPALVTFETAAQWVDGGAGAPPPASVPASSAGAGVAGETAATAAGKSRPRRYATPPLDVANYMYWTFCSSGDTRWHNMRGSMKALYGGDVHPSDLRLQQQSERDDDVGSPKGISRLTTMLSQKMSLSHIVLDRDKDKEKDGARDSRDGTAAGMGEAAAASDAGGAATHGSGGHPRERHPARPSVWRERAKHGASGAGGGAKSPFPNLSSLGSARFMRAASFKGVSISMPSFGKKPEDGGDAPSSSGGGGGSGTSDGHPLRRASWMRMRTSREGAEGEGDDEGKGEAAAAATKEGEDSDNTELAPTAGGEEGASEEKASEPGLNVGNGTTDALEAGERTPPAAGGKPAMRGGGSNGEANGGWGHQDQGPSPSGSPPRPETPPPPGTDFRSMTGPPSQVPSAGAGSRGRSSTMTSVGTVEEDGKSDDGDSDASASGDEAEQQRANAAVSYGEPYEARVERLRGESPFAGVPGWGLDRMICKSNDDLRQEVFIMQLISFYAEVFHKERLALWLKPYRILSTGKSTGLIEVLSNSISLDGLKKSPDYAGSLRAHFERLYGPPGSEGLLAAQRRFAQSLAGYSLVCYLLRIKDRHNGNIMLTARGRVIHIDFGFVLGLAPGNDFSFERAPFKLTLEYAEAMGGRGSPAYVEFARLFAEGLAAARKYATPASTLIEIMMFQSEFPCFAKFGRAALTGFRERLLLDVADSEIPRRAQAMVDRSYNYRGTRIYDRFQLATNKIQP